MNLKFTNWYTQALGATLGIIACIYSYLNGYISTYSNIDTYFDSLGFGGIISSYCLLPLCIVTLLLAITKSYASDKKFLNVSLEDFNIGIIISTVVIGFMGARIYFTLPAMFMLFNLINHKTTANVAITESENIERVDTQTVATEDLLDENTSVFKRVNELSVEDDDTSITTEAKEDIKEKEVKILDTKLEMAKQLLTKNSQREFIIELTGLTLEELKVLEEELKK